MVYEIHTTEINFFFLKFATLHSHILAAIQLKGEFFASNGRPWSKSMMFILGFG